MDNNVKDIRIKKTKTKLKKSLLILLKIKPIETISVTQPCTRAEINRNTFYSHYENPHKLLDDIENELYQELIQTLMKANLTNIDFNSFILSIFNSIYKNQDICSVLFGEYGDTEFIQNAIEVPRLLVIETWKKTLNISDFEASIRYSYFAGGSISVIKEWVNSGYIMRKEVVAEYLEKIIMIK